MCCLDSRRIIYKLTHEELFVDQAYVHQAANISGLVLFVRVGSFPDPYIIRGGARFGASLFHIHIPILRIHASEC